MLPLTRPELFAPGYMPACPPMTSNSAAELFGLSAEPNDIAYVLSPSVRLEFALASKTRNPRRKLDRGSVTGLVDHRSAFGRVPSLDRHVPNALLRRPVENGNLHRLAISGFITGCVCANLYLIQFVDYKDRKRLARVAGPQRFGNPLQSNTSQRCISRVPHKGTPYQRDIGLCYLGAPADPAGEFPADFGEARLDSSRCSVNEC